MSLFGHALIYSTDIPITISLPLLTKSNPINHPVVIKTKMASNRRIDSEITIKIKKIHNDTKKITEKNLILRSINYLAYFKQ